MQGNTHYGPARDVARILEAVGEISREDMTGEPPFYAEGWRQACVRVAMDLVESSPDPELRALLLLRFREAQKTRVDTAAVPRTIAP